MSVLPARSICVFLLSVGLSTLSGCGSSPTQPGTEPPLEPTETETEQDPSAEAPTEPETTAEACEPAEPVIIEKVVACPKPVVCPKVVSSEVSGTSDLVLVGRIEYVDLMSVPLRKKASIDTGADTTSINAANIVEFERDGKKWVKFTVTDGTTDDAPEISAPVVRYVRSKQHGNDNARREVVELELKMGALREKVEVTLSDREKYDFPILIGRNFIEGKAVVDVSRKYLTLDKD